LETLALVLENRKKQIFYDKTKEELNNNFIRQVLTSKYWKKLQEEYLVYEDIEIRFFLIFKNIQDIKVNQEEQLGNKGFKKPSYGQNFKLNEIKKQNENRYQLPKDMIIDLQEKKVYLDSKGSEQSFENIECILRIAKSLKEVNQRKDQIINEILEKKFPKNK